MDKRASHIHRKSEKFLLLIKLTIILRDCFSKLLCLVSEIKFCSSYKVLMR